MTHALGFVALTLNLTSMAMRKMLYLRTLSLIANSIYVAYGLLIQAYPIAIGGFIAAVIHSINIYRLKHPKEVTVQK